MVKVASASAVAEDVSCVFKEGGRQGKRKHTSNEEMKSPHGARSQPGLQRAPGNVPALLPHRPNEIRTQDGKHGQADDLEAETCDHDVDTRLFGIVVIRCISQSAADSLQDKREDVAADEDDGVGARFEASQMFAVDEDDAREGEVDGGGEEARGYCDDNEVPGSSLVSNEWTATTEPRRGEI